MVVGAGTEVIAAEGRIVTPGGLDAHIHFICPQLVTEAISAGLTTMVGGGTGPATGTNATTCTPGEWNLHRMLEAAEAFPVNLGFLGKGNGSAPEPLREQVLAGAIGLKLHEDWGTTPAAIDTALAVADELDVQVAIHTDTLNEAGFVEDSIRAFKGRTIHTYHTDGAGGRPPRHADGLPPPDPVDPGGPRVRRVAHPRRDDRGRGRPARPRRDQHDVVGLAGDGARRRGRDPDLADRRQDEAAARPAPGRGAGRRQPADRKSTRLNS